MKHLFTDETDTVAAENIEDANLVWSNYVGDDHNDEDDPWRMIPDEEMFSVYFEDEIKQKYLPAGVIVEEYDEDDPFPFGYTFGYTAKAIEWANCGLTRRDSFLCSTEV